MTDKLKVFYYALWIAHPLLEVGVAYFMIRRGMLRNFKFFFGYILTQINHVRGGLSGLRLAQLYRSYSISTGFAMPSASPSVSW